MAKHHYLKKHMALNKIKKMAKKTDSSLLVLLEGPSGSGKTYIAHRISKNYEKTTILTCRDAIRMAVGRKESNWFMNKESSLGECVIIEDIDFLRGRDQTQERLAKIIQNWRDGGTHVVLSGVEVRKRLPQFMGALGETDVCVDLS